MSEYDDLLRDLTVERYRPVPPRPGDAPPPVTPGEAIRNARLLYAEVGEFEASQRGDA